MDEPDAKKPRLAPNLTPIVDRALTDPVPATTVYTARITDKKSTSKVIAALNRDIPIEKLQHLKRIRNPHIVVCSEKGVESIEDFLKEKCSEVADFLADFCTQEVPAFGPKTRAQFAAANKLWPCNFHPDKYIERLLSGAFFDDSELILHRSLMEVAVEMGDGAVVYSPDSSCVVAIGIDNRKEHPLQHPVMSAIDNVARTQGGGSWHGSEITATLERVKKVFTNIAFDRSPQNAYLCTNYYIYTVNEPCVMCAMALVHARVKRVFFAKANSKGGLGTRGSIHLAHALNHHYEVFTGFSI